MINYTVRTIKTVPNVNSNVVDIMENEIMNFFKLTNTKQKTNMYTTYNHINGKHSYVFSIPGIDPKNLKVLNKNRNITILNVDKVVGVVTTYDQIDLNEIKVDYKFGQLILTIEPNVEKYKEYEVKINF